MKRFLILFSLIAFLTVSCAGPNKVGWTKPDYRQDQFENDRKECIDSIEKNLDSETFFCEALKECLEKKDYEFKKAEEPPSGSKVTAKEIGLIALFFVLMPFLLWPSPHFFDNLFGIAKFYQDQYEEIPGPNKVGWTKPNFCQDQFENDRKECIDSIEKNLDSETFFWEALEECLEKKDYEFKKADEPPSGNK